MCGLEYDKPGSLFDLLQIFKQYGSNLTHIKTDETFLGQYVFFIDYESPLSEQTIMNCWSIFMIIVCHLDFGVLLTAKLNKIDRENKNHVKS